MARASAGERIRPRLFDRRQPVLEVALDSAEVGQKQETGLQSVPVCQHAEALATLLEDEPRVGKTHE
jgi:hypothetical protein